MTSLAPRANGGVGGGGGKGARGLGRGGSVTGRGDARAGRRPDGAKRLCRYLGVGAAERGRRRCRVRAEVCGTPFPFPSGAPASAPWGASFLSGPCAAGGGTGAFVQGCPGDGPWRAGEQQSCATRFPGRSPAVPSGGVWSRLVQPPLAGAGGAARRWRSERNMASPGGLGCRAARGAAPPGPSAALPPAWCGGAGWRLSASSPERWWGVPAVRVSKGVATLAGLASFGVFDCHISVDVPPTRISLMKRFAFCCRRLKWSALVACRW